MKTRIAMITAAAALLAAVAVLAEPLPWTQFPGPMTLTYASRYVDPSTNLQNEPMSRKVLDLENDTEVRLTFPAPDPAKPDQAVVTAVAKLRSGATKEETITVTRRGDRMAWTHYHLMYRDPAGKTMREADYDPSNPALGYPPDLYQNYSVLFVLMGMKFESNATQTLQLWSTPRVIIGVTVKVAGKETITVPAGSFECYRVEVAPLVDDYFGGVVGRIVRPFVPPYKFWYETAAPHRPIKFETGVAATPNLDLPSVVRELTKVEAKEGGK